MLGAPGTVFESCARDLAALGWQETTRGPSRASFQRGRCLIALGVSSAGPAFWNVFPTLPPVEALPKGVVTRGEFIPVAQFIIEPADGDWCASTRDFVRGKVVAEPFFKSDARAVFDRLLGESLRRVEAFLGLEIKGSDR